jgi:NitT/TauT family transport system ATP-binding protein
VVLTPAPTTVQETQNVDLPSPRDQIETKEQPEFARLRAHVYRSIKRKQTSAKPEHAPEQQPATTRS